jgi:guanidinopropionase
MIKKIESYPELADPQLRPRYSGIPTFFRLPHSVRLEQVDIGLVGVPFDGGVTNRPGARHGPREIRSQSSLIRKINQATGVAPFDLVRVADPETLRSNSPSSCRRSPKSPPSSLLFMRLA